MSLARLAVLRSRLSPSPQRVTLLASGGARLSVTLLCPHNHVFRGFRSRGLNSRSHGTSVVSLSTEDGRTHKKRKRKHWGGGRGALPSRRQTPEERSYRQEFREAVEEVRGKGSQRVFSKPFDFLWEAGTEPAPISEALGWVVIAGVVVIALGSIFALFTYSLPGVGTHSVYEQAWETIREDPRLQARLGRPLVAQRDIHPDRPFRALWNTEWVDELGFRHKRIHFYARGSRRIGRVEVECVFSPEASGMLGVLGKAQAIWKWKTLGEPLLRWAYIDYYEIGGFVRKQGTHDLQKHLSRLAMSHPEQPWLISEEGHIIYPYMRLVGRPTQFHVAKSRPEDWKPKPVRAQDFYQLASRTTPLSVASRVLQEEGVTLDVEDKEKAIARLMSEDPEIHMHPPLLDFDKGPDRLVYPQHVERDWTGLFPLPKSREG